jgi:hypothetical protein
MPIAMAVGKFVWAATTHRVLVVVVDGRPSTVLSRTGSNQRQVQDTERLRSRRPQVVALKVLTHTVSRQSIAEPYGGKR